MNDQLEPTIDRLMRGLEAKHGKELRLIAPYDILEFCAVELLEAQQRQFVVTVREVETPNEKAD